MRKNVKIKTVKNSLSVSAYLNSIEPAQARRDAKLLAKLFKQTTLAKPKMWGSSIVGYGQYTYYRANGDEGKMAASGFSIRKSGPVLYVMLGYKDYQHILDKIGPHKLGKSCLYLKNLEGVDLQALAKLIKAGMQDLKKLTR
ncbi:MAG: hypothetical protein ACI8XV_000758 [Arenicella sp.]|jgi:hypothetical protein